MLLSGNRKVLFMKDTPPVNTAKQFGALVRSARKAQGLTQEDLAGMTSTGRRFISDLENGKASIQLEKALHVLSSLGVALCPRNTWKDDY
jgi:y4mF family transcriptional regulator